MPTPNSFVQSQLQLKDFNQNFLCSAAAMESVLVLVVDLGSQQEARAAIEHAIKECYLRKGG